VALLAGLKQRVGGINIGDAGDLANGMGSKMH
jgi:hypothetical protein